MFYEKYRQQTKDFHKCDNSKLLYYLIIANIKIVNI